METNKFFRDSTRMVLEETEPGRIRCVTAWDGTRHVQEQTVSKEYWETLRGPLVEVPNPFPNTPES